MQKHRIYRGFVLLSTVALIEVGGFVPSLMPPCVPPQSLLLLQMVDPFLFAVNALDMDITMEVGVALVGAAAGAMSQVPRMQALERELQTTKDALTLSEADLVAKIELLEEKLFAMDQEFEEQTARFQREYHRKQQQKAQALEAKLRSEMQFKLEILRANEKSANLMSQAVTEHGRIAKQEELSQLKLRQSQLSELNKELEQTLRSMEEELNRIRAEASTKNKFFFW